MMTLLATTINWGALISPASLTHMCGKDLLVPGHKIWNVKLERCPGGGHNRLSEQLLLIGHAESFHLHAIKMPGLPVAWYLSPYSCTNST
jgi:hypothetical protein